MSVYTIPDVTKLVVDYLKANADIRALVKDRVAPTFAGRLPMPCLTVQRPAGSPTTDVHWAEGTLITVEAWAQTGQGGLAYSIAATAQSVLRDGAFVGAHALGVVNGTRTEVSIRDVPDPQARARKSFDIRVFVHPTP